MSSKPAAVYENNIFMLDKLVKESLNQCDQLQRLGDTRRGISAEAVKKALESATELHKQYEILLAGQLLAKHYADAIKQSS